VPGSFFIGPWERSHPCFGENAAGYQTGMALLLYILAIVLIVAGVLALFRRQLLWGIVLIVVGLIVGPFGGSLIGN